MDAGEIELTEEQAAELVKIVHGMRNGRLPYVGTVLEQVHDLGLYRASRDSGAMIRTLTPDGIRALKAYTTKRSSE